MLIENTAQEDWVTAVNPFSVNETYLNIFFDWSISVRNFQNTCSCHKGWAYLPSPATSWWVMTLLTAVLCDSGYSRSRRGDGEQTLTHHLGCCPAQYRAWEMRAHFQGLAPSSVFLNKNIMTDKINQFKAEIFVPQKLTKDSSSISFYFSCPSVEPLMALSPPWWQGTRRLRRRGQSNRVFMIRWPASHIWQHS